MFKPLLMNTHIPIIITPVLTIFLLILCYLSFHQYRLYKRKYDQLIEDKSDKDYYYIRQINAINHQITILKDNLSNTKIDRDNYMEKYDQLIEDKSDKYYYIKQVDKLNEQIAILKDNLNNIKIDRNNYKKEYEQLAAQKSVTSTTGTANKYYEQICNSSTYFYQKKSTCMNANESRMYYYINKALNQLITDKKERSNIYIFPQVSLHSFITIKESGLNTEELEAARKHLLNKNIDFLICRSCKRYASTQSQNCKVITYYEYCPVLMIEIDGSSHDSSSRYGAKIYSQQKNSDIFKNSLSDNLHIPLLRYKITNDRVHKEDYAKIAQELKKYFTK